MNTANDTGSTSVQLTLAQELSQLIANIITKELDFLAHEGIEILHDFRVDLRKLRTWLKIFDIAGYPVQKLKKHSLHCHYIGGDLRNFDVLLHWAKQNSDSVSPKFLKTLKNKRKKLKKAFLKELIDGNALQKLQTSGRDFILHIKGLSSEELETHVHDYIERKNQRYSRILPTAGDNLEQLHEMRKILKKVRYSMQLLSTIDLEYLHAIKEIQDILGYINDRRVWIALMKSDFKKEKETSKLKNIFKLEMKKKIEEFKEYIATREARL
ncbi:MAG: CHAD domain-containing protein [Sulfuricurvum sp.]|nr:CHAD domain-containing protein [Sulfuricurvum sp.]